MAEKRLIEISIKREECRVLQSHEEGYDLVISNPLTSEFIANVVNRNMPILKKLTLDA